MQYIDIYSGTRDRSAWPNPMNFDALIKTNVSRDNIIDPVSRQVVRYPDIRVVPPISFYTETLQEPLDEVVETEYLPYMYQFGAGDTTIQLDELPIQSTNSTTSVVDYDPSRPNYTYPLGEADEYYAGNILENVNTGEYRTIVSMRYDTTESNVLQSGTVLYASAVGSDYFLYVSNVNLFEIPFSNVSRYYQGKYILMTSGNSSGAISLIIDYLPNVLDSAFQLQSSFSSVSAGDTFKVVTNKKWFAIIDSAFNDPLPTYPSYRTPLPSAGISFNFRSIYDSTRPINRLSIDLQYQQGIGVCFINDNGTTSAGLELGDVYYIQSSENNANSWFPVIRIDINAIIKSGIALTNFSGQEPFGPYLQFTTYEKSDTNLYWSTGDLGQYINNNPPNVWTSTTQYSITAYTNVTPPDVSPNLHMSSYKIYKQYLNGFTNSMDNADYIIYAESGTDLQYVVVEENVSSISGTILTAVYVTPLATYIYNDQLVIMYADDTGCYYIVSTTIDLSNISLDARVPLAGLGTPAGYDYINISRAYSYDMNVILANTNTIPSLCMLFYESLNIYVFIYDYDNNVTYQIDLTSAFTSVGTNASFLVLRLEQTTYNGELTTFIFGANSLVGLFVAFNVQSFNQTWDFLIIDNSPVYDMDTINTGDNIVIMYSRQNLITLQYEVVALQLEDLNIQVSVPYRIRYGIPDYTGTQLLGLTNNTVTLPITAIPSNYNLIHNYISILSKNMYQVPSDFYLFNYTSEVIDYDPLTGVATLKDLFPVSNPTQYTIAPIGKTSLFLQFDNPADLGEDSSGNEYDFTVNAGTTYVLTLTDVNNKTLDDVVRISSAAPSGLSRNILNDYNLAFTFLTGAQTANSGIIGLDITFTISCWFYVTTVAGTQTLLYYKGLNMLPSPPIGQMFISYTLSGSSILIKFAINNGTSPDINITVSSAVSINTWYNLTHVKAFNAQSIVYVNGVVAGTSGANPANIACRKWFTDMYVGHNNGTNILNNGYMKNIIMTPVVWTQQDVLSVYNNALQTPAYTLEWEVLGDVYDNFTPLDVIASRVDQSEAVCFEVSLTHLILPNVTLLTGGIGNILAFQPFIYVQFLPINPTYNSTAFYSNTPFSKNMLFKVPITNANSPTICNFVNNYSNMTMTVKFRPTDNFHFAIYMANGELFIADQQDTQPPLPPNPLLQMSATFGFRRLKVEN